jgi:hypothetical protein
MFNVKEGESIRNGAKLVVEFSGGSAYTKILLNTAKIYYRRFNNNTLLFESCIFESNLTTLVRNLRYSSFANTHSEELKFLYLEWLIEELIKTAKSENKNRLVIISDLPHTTELFANFDFDSLSKTTDNKFKGSKFIKGARSWKQ